MKAVGRPRSAPRFPHLLPWEDERAYAARIAELVAAYAPVGPIERAAVERIALLLQRRDRLALAERAVHMAAMEDATDARQGYGAHHVEIARRASVAGPGYAYELDVVAKLHPHLITDALAKSEADDARDLAVLTDDREATAEALAVLAAGGADAYERALSVVTDATREAWESWIGSAPRDGTPEYAATAESFRTYIENDIAHWEGREAVAIEARPALRLQAIGESFNPARMERLLSIDTRIDRDLERAVTMLVKLQELRLREPARSTDGDGAPLVEGGAPRSRITAHAGESEAVVPIMRQRRAPADKRSCGS
jgi:hypothetical protein